jgi:hypothetical protein
MGMGMGKGKGRGWEGPGGDAGDYSEEALKRPPAPGEAPEREATLAPRGRAKIAEREGEGY